MLISDALVVDCALTGLLPPAPPASPAFPLRPLAQAAGHANPLSPLMFSREEFKKKVGFLFSRSTAPPCDVLVADESLQASRWELLCVETAEQQQEARPRALPVL